MSHTRLPKKLVIRDVPNKYIMGKDSDMLSMSLKIFMRKRQKKASKVFKIDTTIGEFRKQRIFCFDSIFLTKTDANVIYISQKYVITSFLKLFEKMGTEVKIPKKYNDNLDFYVDSIYDVLMFSNRPYNLV